MRSVASVCLILSLAACASPADVTTNESLNSQNPDTNGTDPNGAYSNASISYTQVQGPTTPKVDILFVVDTSSSLDVERATISSGLSNLLSTFPNGAHFRIAIMLANVNVSEGSGMLYRKASEPIVLDSETMTINQMQNHLQTKLSNPPQQNGGQGEAGIISLTRGITGTQLATNRSQGFFRTNAALAVVFISDENDICYPGQVIDSAETNLYNTVCKENNVLVYSAPNLYNRLLTVQGNNPLSVSGMIYSGENGPVILAHPGDQDELGLGYLELLDLADGESVDLTDPSPDPNGPGVPSGPRLTQGLEFLGAYMNSTLYSPKTIFVLNHSNVDASSIVAKVNGAVVSHTYNPATNAVTVNPSQAGHPGDVVTINFRYLL